MKYDEFHLNYEFKTGSEKTFRCTDIGQRVIVAICIDDYPDDTNAVSWANWQVAGEVRTPTNVVIGFNFCFGQQRDNTQRY